MNELVTSTMREFVEAELKNITDEHNTIISGWKSVTMTNENVLHLHNLFKSCDKHQIRAFEQTNFLGDKYWGLATTQLNRAQEPITDKNHDTKAESDQVVAEKKKKKKKQKQIDEPKKNHQVSNTLPEVLPKSEISNTSPRPIEEKIQKVSSDVINSDLKDLESDLKESKQKFDILSEKLEETVNNELKKEEKADDHVFAKPQPIDKAKAKKKSVETRNTPANILSTLQDRYISAESNNLKQNLHKLASDISVQEKSIKENLESGKATDVDNGVLADFISRANTVLKETEAVTVRKIAEAETRKFLSSANVNSEPYFESISNELMHDIWPKTNRWRSFMRIEKEIIPSDPKIKKKLEDGIEKAVHTAIKSAGEPLNKKQIGQIRKAAIVYRDFDAIEQDELEYRSNQTLKLVEYVSAYEATNQMDELTRLRLAIAFCTKRRDYFLKARPKNFMQFSYMYIFLLEKINSKSASICACLNQRATKKSEFDELEEVMLNLFHEDYFLEEKE